jgi:hypothetical protein
MPKSEMPTVVYHNVETGERTERPMTDAEYAVYLEDVALEAAKLA